MPVKPTVEAVGFTDADGIRLVKSGEILRDDFGGSSLNTSKWWAIATGTGMAYSVTGSELVITTGTTSGDELVFRSKARWRADNLRADFQIRLSQRIANQEFRVRLTTLDGSSYVEWMFDGTTATTQKIQSAQNGSTYTTSATSLPTLATNPPAYGYNIDLRRGSAVWGYRLLHSYSQTTYTSQQRDRLFPTADEEVYVEIRAKNTGTAGSTTTFAVDVVNVQHDAPVGVTVEGGTGGIESTRSVPVTLAGSNLLATTTMGTVTPIAGSASGGTPSRTRAAASTNATSVKASAGRVHSIHLTSNAGGVTFFKLFNKASAPTVGTDVPILVVRLAAGAVVNVEPPLGIQCSAGIAFCMVTGSADTDATAVTAGDIDATITYT